MDSLNLGNVNSLTVVNDSKIKKILQNTGPRDHALITVIAGFNTGDMYYVKDRSLIVGRLEQSDIKINDDGVSRRHAMLYAKDNQILIKDLHSANGVFVNGVRIRNPIVLDTEDRIAIGTSTIFKFSMCDQLDVGYLEHQDDALSRDYLTRAYNKKYFTAHLHGQFSYATQLSAPLSLILLDIDHFKQVNDTFGHVAGDKVLAELSRQLHDLVRVEDVFARYGGEEFAILSPGLTVIQALRFAEGIRERVMSCQFRYQDSTIPVTVSIGVTSLPTIPANSPTQFLEAADAALYQAKKNGRNCVEVTKF